MKKKHKLLALRTTALSLVIASVVTLLPTGGPGFWAKASNEKEEIYIVEELTELRTENSKTYLKSDGSRTAVFSTSALHYEEDGKWLEIDNTFETTQIGGEEYYTNTAAGVDVLLPSKLDSDTAVSIEKDGYLVSISHAEVTKSASGKKKTLNAKASAAKRKKMSATELAGEVVNANDITYNDVYTNTDIKYDVLANGLKESIILNKKPNKHAKFSYTVKTNGLMAELKEDGSIEFYSGSDNEKTVVFVMPAPYMFDSNNVYSHDIAVTLNTKENGDYELIYTPSSEWLRDKSRAYPVTIDPTVEGAEYPYFGFVYTNSGYPEKAYREGRVRLGTFNMPDDVSNFVGYIASPDLSLLGTNNRITKATLTLGYSASSWLPSPITIGAYDITESFNISEVVLETAPAHNPYAIDIATASVGADLEFDVTNLAYNWYKKSGVYGVRLARADGGTEPWFYDYNSVTYEINYELVSGPASTSREIDIGAAGTVYINDRTGHLTLVRNDIGVGGNLMPVNISMIYDITAIHTSRGDMTPANGMINSGAYGRGYRSNYSQRIEYVSGKSKEPYYLYIGEDGNEYYFDFASDETNANAAYKDNSESGYTLSVNAENLTDYTAVTLKDSADQRYYFDANGRLIKIVSSAKVAEGVTQSSVPSAGKTYEEGVIKITYTVDGVPNLAIDTITDGAGRVYKFVYSGYSEILDRIDYLGYGTEPLMSVDYAMGSRCDAGLDSVTYADGRTVNYYYDTKHRLTEVIDSDQYKFQFGYEDEGLSVIDIKEYGYDKEQSKHIEGEHLIVDYGYNETRYYKVNKETESVSQKPYQAMQFNELGDITNYLVTDVDSNGLYYISAQYKPSEDDSSARNELIDLKYFDNQGTDLFKGIDVYADWNTNGTNSYVSDNTGINGGKGIVLKGSMNAANSISKTFTVDGKGDTDYSLGFWVNTEMFAKKGDRDISVDFELKGANGIVIDKSKISLNGEVLGEDKPATIQINPHTRGWQFVSATITRNRDAKNETEADAEFKSITLTINNDYRLYDAVFSEFALYYNPYNDADNTENSENKEENTNSGTEGGNENTEGGSEGTEGDNENAEGEGENTESGDTSAEKDDPLEDTTTSEMSVTNTTRYDKYGNTTESIVTNGRVSITEKTEYTENRNYMSAVIDALGNKTEYDYDLELGTLDSVTGPTGGRVEYDYNAVGTLTGINQSVTGLVGGDKLSVNYSYDAGGRTNEITHNNFKYSFVYDPFGVLTEVKVAGNSLVKYNYDADYQPTSTVYGNSQTIYYTYDNQGQLTGISTAADSVNRVSFTYDSQGNIVGINDYVNSRFTVVTYDDKNNATTTVYDSLEEGKKALHEYKTVDDVYTETVDGHTYSVTYSYDKDGRLTKAAYTIGNNTVSKELHYDDLDRTTAEVISAKIGETIKQILNTSFAYNDVAGFGTSNQVSVLQNKAEGYKNTIAYEYDANGYITKAGDVTYSYDEAGQLTRVNDPQYGTTVYVYDVGGNIKYVKSYDYTVGELGTCLNTVTYGYNNAWKDLLTNYNGQAITYDGAGNPLNYRDGMVFSWELGRQLKTLSVGGKTYSYKYNSDNLRTQKTDGTATTDFYWVDGQLTYQTDGTNDIYFLYDDNSSPIGFVLNETAYYYVKNLQGDIIAILDSNGNCMVEYTYDAWGKLLNTVDNSAINLGTINPLRYRGYYYDQETGLYYLQSRYYDPTVGRFINADVLLDTESISGFNLFSYCGSCPIICLDRLGYGKTYVIYYNNPGSDFYKQAMNSPYYNSKSKNVYMHGVHSVAGFVKAWNNMSGSIDYVYLLLHGGKGKLYFYGEDFGFQGSPNFKSLKAKNVKKRIYLLSCSGGAGKEGNNVAWMFAKLTKSKVYACTGGVTYRKGISGKYYAGKSLRDFGVLKTFYYGKKYIFWGPQAPMSYFGWW